MGEGWQRHGPKAITDDGEGCAGYEVQPTPVVVSTSPKSGGQSGLVLRAWQYTPLRARLVLLVDRTPPRRLTAAPLPDPGEGTIGPRGGGEEGGVCSAPVSW